MPQETEIKLRVEDLRQLQGALGNLGARAAPGKGGRVHEFNVIFDTRGRKLAKQEQLLRIRWETPQSSQGRPSAKKAGQATVTFKGPVRGRRLRTRHKVREEMETRVQNGQVLKQVFQALGYRPWFRYEKFRTTLALPKKVRWAQGLLIELDETPMGVFAELEGPPRAIDRLAKELGYAKRDYIVANYLELYRQECRRRGHPPRDMLFRKGT